MMSKYSIQYGNRTQYLEFMDRIRNDAPELYSNWAKCAYMNLFVGDFLAHIGIFDHKESYLKFTGGVEWGMSVGPTDLTDLYNHISSHPIYQLYKI